MVDISSHVRTDYKAVDKRDELRSVMGWLAGDATKVPIVLDGQKPFGIVNERALMARQLDGKAKIEPYALPTRALPLTASVEEARDRMAELRAAYLPVTDARGKLAGYVRAIDLARENGRSASALDVAVPITALQEQSTLGDALNLFQKEYVDFLPVVRSDGRLTGVLPRRTVLRMEFNTGDKGRKDAGGEKFTMLHDPVGGVMDEAPAFVKPTSSFEEVLDTLDEAGYAIVRKDEGHLLGIVTPETLFRGS